MKHKFIITILISFFLTHSAIANSGACDEYADKVNHYKQVVQELKDRITLFKKRIAEGRVNGFIIGQLIILLPRIENLLATAQLNLTRYEMRYSQCMEGVSGLPQSII